MSLVKKYSSMYGLVLHSTLLDRRGFRDCMVYGVWCMVKLCRLVACSCEFGFINTSAVIG